ncbi:MAG TPA: hypothetical protein VNJ02_18370 [Vicinamibacterales bacterium]|nr:hypothetical protein [Vicinamibacterales bacterium]
MVDASSAARTEVGARLAAYRRQLRLAKIVTTVGLWAAAAGVMTASAITTGAEAGTARIAAAAIFALVAGVSLWTQWRRDTLSHVAAVVETRIPGLQNLVITAAEALPARSLHPLIDGALFTHAAARLRAIEPRALQSMKWPVTFASAAIAFAVTLIVMAPRVVVSRMLTTNAGGTSASESPPVPGELRVVITPPAYTGGAERAFADPTHVTAVEGSRIRLEMARTGSVQVAEAGQPPIVFEIVGDRSIYQFTAAQSRILLVQARASSPQRPADRLLQVEVEPDRRPLVRITAPAKDLIFGDGTGRVAVEIEARDDFALSSLNLRYTRVAGSGETFTFEEGVVPVVIARASDGEWRGRATLALEQFKMGDGDTLVYRAVAADRKPSADPATSESFLIEVGRLAGAASTGFAVPDQRDRQGISQQMVIIKTERLHAQREKLPAGAVEEQARLLAIEQRMVKAEFVFMTGGEVADEVAEAEHAHELAEGRQENAAQVELLSAIREMSRAEARLNASDTAQALVFERAALRALQRAFDRRRYLLRALPERARIDLTRRLTGDRTAAASTVHLPDQTLHDPAVAATRAVLSELARAIHVGSGLDAALASRILSIDPSSELLRKAVATLASAAPMPARIEAAKTAQTYLAGVIRARLPASPLGRISSDPLRGRMAQEGRQR